MLWKWSRRKKKWAAVFMGVVVVSAAGFGVYQVATGQKEEIAVVTKETTVQTGNLTVGITESGNVSIDSLTQSFTLDWSESSSSSNSSADSAGSSGSSDKTGEEAQKTSGSTSGVSAITMQSSTAGSSAQTNTDAALVVEKVYVSAGQQVKEGEELLKLTKESVEEVKEIYQSNYEDAKEALQQAKLTQEAEQLTAEYDYKQAAAQGESASDAYQAALASLEAQVSSAKTAYQKAKKGIETLPDEIASLKKQIKAQKSVSGAAGAQEDTGKNSNTMENSSQLSESSSSQGESTSVLSQLQQQLSEKQAQLSQYRSSLASLKSAYHAAIKAQTTGKIEAKSVYNQSKLNAKNAKTTYQATVSSLKAEVKEAKEAYTQAEEARQEFTEFVKGGVVKAEYTGTLASIGYQAGDRLSTATDIATYLDDDGVTITVSVSEEDVSNIKVGDSVNIYLSAYEDEMFSGEVTSISSTSTGDSTVSYPVVVTMTSDVSKVYSGMSSEVTFVSKEVKDVLYVSNKAITTEGSSSYVLLKKDDGTTQKTKVTTGFSDGHNVEVTSGLKQGDICFIESQVSQ